MTATGDPALTAASPLGPGRAEILAVGDAHGLWDDVDRAFVEGAGADVVLFCGDLGDEDVAVAERIAAVAAPKAVVLGNHDAWWSSRRQLTPAFRRLTEVLAPDHVGLKCRRFGNGGFAVLGARSYSWGGPMRRFTGFYRETMGIEDEAGSATRIVAAAGEHPGAPLIVLAHNGPTGLGEGRDAIFGRDFLAPHIDFGDADLEEGLRRLRAEGRHVPLLIAGHMHERLHGGGWRRRVAERDGTVHVNAAVVPRHFAVGGGLLRHFVRVVIEGGEVALLEDIWVDDARAVAARRPLRERPRSPPPGYEPA